jgi:phosphoserine phosphatase RsbU/P
LGLLLGDVCGMGPSAAVITSLTRYTLRAAAVYDADPVAVLQNLDTVLQQRRAATEMSFCTAIFGLLTPSGAGFDIELASGGQAPALLLGADGTARYVQTRADRRSASCRNRRLSPPTFTWPRATRLCSTPTA